MLIDALDDVSVQLGLRNDRGGRRAESGSASDRSRAKAIGLDVYNLFGTVYVRNRPPRPTLTASIRSTLKRSIPAYAQSLGFDPPRPRQTEGSWAVATHLLGPVGS